MHKPKLIQLKIAKFIHIVIQVIWASFPPKKKSKCQSQMTHSFQKERNKCHTEITVDLVSLPIWETYTVHHWTLLWWNPWNKERSWTMLAINIIDLQVPNIQNMRCVKRMRKRATWHKRDWKPLLVVPYHTSYAFSVVESIDSNLSINQHKDTWSLNKYFYLVTSSH